MLRAIPETFDLWLRDSDTFDQCDKNKKKENDKDKDQDKYKDNDYGKFIQKHLIRVMRGHDLSKKDKRIPSESNSRDFCPLRHLNRVMRRHVVTKERQRQRQWQMHLWQLRVTLDNIWDSCKLLSYVWFYTLCVNLHIVCKIVWGQL